MRIRTLWRNLVHRRQMEEELSEEIRSYQGMLEDSGLSRREALLELGGAAQLQERVRDVRLGTRLETTAAELRQAMRALRRNPALTLLATLMLALGMGASTVVFSIFQASLIQPLPFRDADRVVGLAETRLDRGWDSTSFSDANFWDLKAQNHAFEGVAAAHYNDCNFSAGGQPEKVDCTMVTAGFFHVLGAPPLLGREFTTEEGEARDPQRVVILGNRYWRSRFAADPNILGRKVQVDEQPYTIIGVLPPGQPWLDNRTYILWRHSADPDRGSFEFDVIGRLAPGVTTKAAEADLQRVAASLAQNYPKEDKGIGFRLTPSSTWIASDTTRRALWVLLGAVTFLLLIACLNIANLLLARGMNRKREIAVRTALGASRGRLVRYVMLESLLLSTFGAALGLGLAFAALHGLQALEIRGVPRLADAGLNPWVLSFSASIAVLTGLLCGLAPSLQAPAVAIAQSLRDGDRQAGSRGQGRLRATLVTAEVALSFFLLVGAGLLVRSFDRMMAVDRGFQTENRLLFTLSLSERYYSKGFGKQFLDDLLTRLQALPQVASVGAISHRPVEGGDPGMGIVAASQRQLTGRAVPWSSWRVATPGYLRAVGLPLLRGRFLQDTDHSVWQQKGEPEPARHVVITDRLAKLILPNIDPVGQHVILWQGQGAREAEVVGVVGDSRERGLSNEPALTVYMPWGPNYLPQEFVVHTRRAPLAAMPEIRTLITSLDPNLPISDVRSFEEIVHNSVSPQRFNTVLLALFSGLALLLATSGIYGVLSYSMSRRTAEIGLRVALGASSRSILAMTVTQGMQPVLLGLVLGAAGSWWLSRYFTALLFDIRPFDLPTYVSVAAILLVTALVACLVPGKRAMRIDPGMALRIE